MPPSRKPSKKIVRSESVRPLKYARKPSVYNQFVKKIGIMLILKN